MSRVYLDHNATSPAPQAVINAVAEAMAVIGNASAQHGHGRDAGRLVAKAREAVGMAMGQGFIWWWTRPARGAGLCVSP